MKDKDSKTKHNSPKRQRRDVLSAIGTTSIIGLAGCITSGSGQSFPSSDITVLITKGEGGATDVYTRNLVGPAIESLGVNAQFEYVTGAGGLRGLSVLLDRASDGHTMCSFNVAGGIFSYLINQPNYKITNFKPIGTTSVGSATMFTQPNNSVSNINDAIKKYNSGKWSVIAGQGNGDATNALILLMKQNKKYNLNYENYTSYGGTAPTAQALAGGEIPLMVGSDGGAREYYRNGDIKAVAALRSEGSPEGTGERGLNGNSPLDIRR
jgi:tripartite-type tricarboxylate transporter receptor subunit TctC